MVDMPEHFFFAQLVRAYPEAKMVMTVRDSPEAWMSSYSKTFATQARQEDDCWRVQFVLAVAKRLGWQTGIDSIKSAIAEGPEKADESKSECFVENNERVRNWTPKETLLEWNVKKGAFWLCLSFLSK